MQCSWCICELNSTHIKNGQRESEKAQQRDKFMSMKMPMPCGWCMSSLKKTVFMKCNEWTKMALKIRHSIKIHAKNNWKRQVFTVYVSTAFTQFDLFICHMSRCDPCDLFYSTLSKTWLLFSKAFICLQFLDCTLHPTHERGTPATLVVIVDEQIDDSNTVFRFWTNRETTNSMSNFSWKLCWINNRRRQR